jgi:hypothetical protein
MGYTRLERGSHVGTQRGSLRGLPNPLRVLLLLFEVVLDELVRIVCALLRDLSADASDLFNGFVWLQITAPAAMDAS